jgi:hypothetical protein
MTVVDSIKSIGSSAHCCGAVIRCKEQRIYNAPDPAVAARQLKTQDKVMLPRSIRGLGSMPSREIPAFPPRTGKAIEAPDEKADRRQSRDRPTPLDFQFTE